ncbi:19368_t:CDS:1 [Gigaspora margarita]|uniref:19368_t:CDS:1 n=1 Tax=Gigaspora margarita TaxID=4874 RepID=A0ABN7UW38_GIGMA|nr:19368_t:CDS:1 [Gigaspora margarita]
MVFLIYQKLFNNFKHMGHQSFHAPCSESLFFEVFQDHIYYFKTNIYKCIFRGQNAYQTLAQVFDSNEWDQKFYKQNQQTYIVIQEKFHLSNKSNAHTIEESEMDIDPLL